MRYFLHFLLIAVLTAAATSTGRAEPLRVMSFNIRYGRAKDAENAWPHRKEAVLETVRRFNPDVLAVQEALAFQLDYLRSELPGYRLAGVGRNDGKRAGEHAALLLRTKRVKLVESGTVWLSETPQQPGSLTWGGRHPRVYTWARIQDNSTGLHLHVVNTHWDHRSQESRTKSADAILRHLSQQGAKKPTIVLGDMNASADNEAIKRLLRGPSRLRDSYALANQQANRTGTFHRFQGHTDGSQIDWVLVSPEWEVTEAGVTTRQVNGRWPSDHFPVWAVLRLPEERSNLETP